MFHSNDHFTDSLQSLYGQKAVFHERNALSTSSFKVWVCCFNIAGSLLGNSKTSE